jgi:proteic killer suppression protein
LQVTYRHGDTELPASRVEASLEHGDRARIRPDQVAKIRRILSGLDAAPAVADVDAPGFRLHRLKGELKDFRAVEVTANWRIIFRFEDGDALDVDLLGY